MNAIVEYANTIYDTLGSGYSERVYHNAMEVMLRQNGTPYETERVITIDYRGHTIGNLRADLIVDKSIVVELKAVKTLNDANRTQLKKYIELLGITKGILINFPQPGGDKIDFFMLG
jgi:GxxExxY protein